jgi:hypothetical protein
VDGKHSPHIDAERPSALILAGMFDSHGQLDSIDLIDQIYRFGDSQMRF